MADFSNETVESITEEVQSSGSFGSSGVLQPWSQDSGSKPESGEPHLECQDEQSELSEKRFSFKWIHYLKGKETNSGGYQPDTELQTEATQVSDEQMDALKSFCASKINLLHHRANSEEKKSSRHKKPCLRWETEAPEIEALNCVVPDELLNRIYFRNLMATLKQVASAKQHIASRCPDCKRKRAELAQSAFLKRKKTLLESRLLQEKIDEHLHTIFRPSYPYWRSTSEPPQAFR